MSNQIDLDRIERRIKSEYEPTEDWWIPVTLSLIAEVRRLRDELAGTSKRLEESLQQIDSMDFDSWPDYDDRD